MSFLKRIKKLGENAAHVAGVRKERVAADLAILIAQEGLKRRDIANRLGITEAALSSRLRGDANLTLDTIGAICDAASVDFDLVFRKRGSVRAKSYWENDAPVPSSYVVHLDMSDMLGRMKPTAPRHGFVLSPPSLTTKAANEARLNAGNHEQEPLAA